MADEQRDFVTFREHAAFKDLMTAQMHDVQMQQARLAHLPNKLDAIDDKLAKLAERQSSPANDPMALAVHRMMDRIDRSFPAEGQPQRSPTILIFFALIGAAALAIGGAKLVGVL